ncbi:MAG: ADP-ribosylglycohydrolase family protein [Allisonella histaminiformans]|uniref:ADP-ribosylglycohydrolase family protein n=1 Tax=Allisonella histaminiformans TaxID=209880 RepID=UPI002A801A63|nr:ADP-ribosylglycohydrolase family protein [Allisonella histaminiformans]MDY3957784.1 ADP-ribosylglycohydrolase family protein [Allisonella histaminiformans]
MLRHVNRLRSAVYGIAIGDALGLPVQFLPRDSYPEVTEIIKGSELPWPAGTWSDDTSLTLATVDSLLTCEGVDIPDMRARFEDWLENGTYTPDGQVFDQGFTTVHALTQGHGCTNEQSNGNGSLMRILPLAFVQNLSDEQIAQVSGITHAHPLSVEACTVYVHAAQLILDGFSLTEALETASLSSEIFSYLADISSRKRNEIHSTGYVKDSLEASFWCLLTTDNFRDALIRAVNLGDDTDTIGAITGGMAGLAYGMESVPDSWMNALRKKEIIERCLASQ